MLVFYGWQRYRHMSKAEREHIRANKQAHPRGVRDHAALREINLTGQIEIAADSDADAIAPYRRTDNDE